MDPFCIDPRPAADELQGSGPSSSRATSLSHTETDQAPGGGFTLHQYSLVLEKVPSEGS